MRTNKPSSWTICVAAIIALGIAFPAGLSGETAAVQSSRPSRHQDQPWSVQVQRVDPAGVELAPFFQAAIYENLVQELTKTKQFNHVFRDGDRNANDIPNLLVLKTIVSKYTPGSETRRAVTTVSGATKLTVRTQLLTRHGNVVFARTVGGNVRFFGGNLRATHNLARNVAKAIKQSSWSGTDQPAPVLSDAVGQ